jgi:hypothetical protein
MAPRHRLLWLVAVSCVGAFSWLGVASEVPRVWSPLPTVIVVAQELTSIAFSEIGFRPASNRASAWLLTHIVPVLFGSMLFITWNLELLKDSAEIPRRSRVALVVLTILTAITFASGWRSGVRHQGYVYTLSMLIVNTLSVATCWTLYRLALRHSSFARSLLFKCVTAVWLVWLAFPWLGQLF